jgi:hypothetical protein
MDYSEPQDLKFRPRNFIILVELIKFRNDQARATRENSLSDQITLSVVQPFSLVNYAYFRFASVTDGAGRAPPDHSPCWFLKP